MSGIQLPEPLALSRLDFCKGAAIIGIIGIHIRPGWFGWQGVHVFLVLSGFLLAYSRLRNEPRPWREWFRRRARRVLPAYWVVSVLGVAVVAIVGAVGLNLEGVSLRQSLSRLPFDVFLLRNWTYRGMFGYPNASLWYVPLLVGLYLVFPLLFQRTRWRAVLVAAVIVEVVYRATSVMWLDGVPVGYGHGFVPGVFVPPPALDQLAAEVPFQLWAPFGFFLSRIGEFALGMGAAFLWVERPEVLDRWTSGIQGAIAGLVLWLGGNALLTVRWGWVAADLLIAVGGVLVLLAVAAGMQRWASPVFRGIARAGVLSLPLFLVHLPVMYVTAATQPIWGSAVWSTVVALILTIVALWGASAALLAFDRSRAADSVARVAIEPLLRSKP